MKDFYGYYRYIVHFETFDFNLFHFLLLILLCSKTINCPTSIRLDKCKYFKLA